MKTDCHQVKKTIFREERKTGMSNASEWVGEYGFLLRSILDFYLSFLLFYHQRVPNAFTERNLPTGRIGDNSVLVA
jgi:hypothetical protein